MAVLQDCIILKVKDVIYSLFSASETQGHIYNQVILYTSKFSTFDFLFFPPYSTNNKTTINP